MLNQRITAYLNTQADAATLAFFRVAFGLMMFLGMVRFALNGWIDKFYIKPVFHFTYYGFSWVQPFGIYTYVLFSVCAFSALMVAAGYKYRLAIILFFLSFTYIELMDKTTYLNHYYFISVVSFVMMFLPANTYFSVDAKLKPSLKALTVPRFTVDILKVLLGIVYFYAGLAKLNSDWLLHAMPLKIWLTGNTHLPVIGPMLGREWVAYAFSYIGAAYDLVIVFLLLNRRTRWFAFVLVVVFHVLTRILFPIGIFPYVMIVSTLIFFSPQFHRKVLAFITGIFSAKAKQHILNPEPLPTQPSIPKSNTPLACLLMVFLFVQLVLPFRYLLYSGELFWTEEGFRFSWRVMLMEKAGYTQFRVVDSNSGKTVYVNNRDFLTAFQEKQMAFQPDFILEYAHFLNRHFAAAGMHNPKVFADSYVALNGRLSTRYIDPNVNLAEQHESFKHKTWILPFKDTILGF